MLSPKHFLISRSKGAVLSPSLSTVCPCEHLQFACAPAQAQGTTCPLSPRTSNPSTQATPPPLQGSKVEHEIKRLLLFIMFYKYEVLLQQVKKKKQITSYMYTIADLICTYCIRQGLGTVMAHAYNTLTMIIMSTKPPANLISYSNTVRTWR